MTIKLSEIVNNWSAVQSLQNNKFPVKVAYRIKRISDKLSSIMTTYNKTRDELITEFGELNEQGVYQVKDAEKIKQYMDKLEEILQVEEDVDFDKINIEELGDIQLKPQELISFIFE